MTNRTGGIFIDAKNLKDTSCPLSPEPSGDRECAIQAARLSVREKQDVR
ncbi:MAG: hypothetical protein ACJAYR_000829 [Sneathiella sp.]|jgi:hypothetical protein